MEINEMYGYWFDLIRTESDLAYRALDGFRMLYLGWYLEWRLGISTG